MKCPTTAQSACPGDGERHAALLEFAALDLSVTSDNVMVVPAQWRQCYVENMPDIAIYGALFVSAFLAATILPVSSEAVLAGLIAAGRAIPSRCSRSRPPATRSARW